MKMLALVSIPYTLLPLVVWAKTLELASVNEQGQVEIEHAEEQPQVGAGQLTAAFQVEGEEMFEHVTAKIKEHSNNCHSGGRCVQNLVDGLTEYGVGGHDALWNRGKEPNIWIVFDLQEPTEVGKIELWGQNEYANCRRDIVGFKLSYLKNGRSYEEALATKNTFNDAEAGPSSCPQKSSNQRPNPDVRTYKMTDGITAQLWKLQAITPNPANDGVFGWMEIKFFKIVSCQEAKENGVKVQPKIKEHSNNCHSGNRCVNRLVDGNTEYGVGGKYDALYNRGQEAKVWMVFDLGEPTVVTRIKLWGQNEQANCKRDIIGFKLTYLKDGRSYEQVLQTTNTWKDPDAGPSSCPQQSATQKPNPDVRTYKVTDGFSSQFWKLQVLAINPSNDGHFGWMEIEFFKDPLPGVKCSGLPYCKGKLVGGKSKLFQCDETPLAPCNKSYTSAGFNRYMQCGNSGANCLAVGPYCRMKKSSR